MKLRRIRERKEFRRTFRFIRDEIDEIGLHFDAFLLDFGVVFKMKISVAFNENIKNHYRQPIFSTKIFFRKRVIFAKFCHFRF